MKSTTFFAALWWLNRDVEKYQHPFCEVGSTVSMWIPEANHVYLGASSFGAAGNDNVSLT